MKDQFLTIVAYCFPLLFIGIIVYINYSGYDDWRTTNHLINNGKEIEGMVLKKQSYSSKSGPTYHLTFSFQPDLKTGEIVMTNEVDYNTHLLNAEGKRVLILYDSNQPTSAQIKGNDILSMSLFRVALFDLVLLILLIVFGIKFYKRS